jgi:arginyl-tRNA synthetase
LGRASGNFCVFPSGSPHPPPPVKSPDAPSKQELLAALAAGLEQLSPGAGEKAAFESPKVAAHGDLACTAAMQLAKPLKRNPRQVAEALRESLLATPAFQQWVDAVEIAGPASSTSA